MSRADAWKVILMLSFAMVVVGFLGYARVDLGMTQEQVNHQLEQWITKTSTVAILVWSQILVAVLGVVVYKVWKHRNSA